MTQNFSDTQLWIVIFMLGLSTWLIRFSFMAILGDRDLPEWMLRHLRYTAVAIMPGLVAPWVIFPETIGGTQDPMRIVAAATAVIIGAWTRSVIAGFFAGLVLFYSTMYLVG
ncbi:MAG: AzlD domain-containing protein [Planktomarina sp.]